MAPGDEPADVGIWWLTRDIPSEQLPENIPIECLVYDATFNYIPGDLVCHGSPTTLYECLTAAC